MHIFDPAYAADNPLWRSIGIAYRAAMNEPTLLIPTAPVIRTVEPGDMPAIASLYAEAVRIGTASFETEPPDEAEMTIRMARLISGGFPYLVADDPLHGVLGYAYAGPYRTRPAYRWTVENSVYVRPETHGRGIGRALLAAIVHESERRGFRQMVAVIGDSANAASIGLHAALGFRLVGTLEAVGFKHGRWLDTVLMQRPLGEAAIRPPRDAG
jgi:phosphinothricin acetyltransferase